jgi:26S proteasome regulatory subunit N2
LRLEAKTDPHYQSQLKSIEAKNSVAHESAILSLSFLQAFTEDDSFLEKKENLEWAAKASHWSKFATIASLALIFKNNKEKAEAVFKKYLPESNTDVVNHYPNGGAIFGLGLTFAGTMNQKIIDKIFTISKSPLQPNQEEAILHACCLSLGLVGFASND